ncbi:MAG: VOC family protein [Pseudomonadota bacterium]
MNASFGIDHPLIAVNNIEVVRDRMISLGFNMTAIGRHPWGTNTSLAMFDGCLIEIMGIHDKRLLDEHPAGGFCFGRHVYENLQEREGIALTALHSTDATADAERAKDAGFTVSGHLDFGRDVTLPDGRTGRTRTTLALMPDRHWPRLSFFLCQQHRPDLIYVPEWLEHPNTACGISGITVLADESDHVALIGKFEGLYASAEMTEDGFGISTANGRIRVRTRQAIEREFATLPSAISASGAPCIVALDLRCKSPAKLGRWIENSGLDHETTGDRLTLTNPVETGNVFLQFSTS